MKDDLFDLLPRWQIAAHVLYGLLTFALVAPVAAALTPVTRRWAKLPRVACGTCGYRMPAVESHCPECRAARP